MASDFKMATIKTKINFKNYTFYPISIKLFLNITFMPDF